MKSAILLLVLCFPCFAQNWEDRGILEEKHEYLIKNALGDSKHIKISKYLGDNFYEVFLPFRGERGYAGKVQGKQMYRYDESAPFVINLSQWAEIKLWKKPSAPTSYSWKNDWDEIDRRFRK